MSEYINSRAQACQNCVKAKAKCYGHNGGKCERCSRLSKECAMQTPVIRKRKTVKTTRQAQTERIAELEARLNSIVSSLSISQPSSVVGDNPRPINTPLDPLDLPTPVSVPISGSNDWRRTPGKDASLDSSIGIADEPPGIQAPIEDKDPADLLDIFRKDLARQAPFILIPKHWSAEIMSTEKPFSYQAIMTVASYHDSVHQIALGLEYLKRLTNDLVLHGKRSLDMLQGLMVYITWYNSLFHCASQLTALLSLAFSMVIDLYLFVPSTSFEGHERFLDEMKGIVTCHQATWGRGSEPSKEEKRVILGCFYLFSCISTNFCRVNPLHWTPYIQHCHDEILNAPENDNDVYLVHLAALQRISEDVKHSGIRGFTAQPRTWNSATAVQFKLLMAELQRFKVSLPAYLQNDVLMLMHYHLVETYLFEVGFSMPPTSIANADTIQRADVLLLCLKSSSALSELYLSIGPKPYINVCPASTTQIYVVMMTLSKLALFDADDWITFGLETSLNLCTLVERVAILIEELSARFDVQEIEKPWLQVSRRMRVVKARYEKLLASENKYSATVQQTTGISEGSLPTMPLFLNQFDLLDEDFWQSLPGMVVSELSHGRP